MKKLTIILIILISTIAHAGVDITHYRAGALRTMVIEWTAESDGSFTGNETTAINGVVGLIETTPGTPAPTALYDITLKNSSGLDIMGGKLTNRSATTTEATGPYNLVEDMFVYQPVRGPLTIAISNNSVANAMGTITIYYTVY